MLTLRDVWIDIASLGNKYLLVDVRPAKEYRDGLPTDVISGYRYDVCLPLLKMEKITIKIDGEQRMEAPTGGPVEVTIEGLVVTAYQDRSGVVRFAARAVNIAPAGAKKS